MDLSINEEIQVCVGDMWISKQERKGIIVATPEDNYGGWGVQHFDASGWGTTFSMTTERIIEEYTFEEKGRIPEWFTKKGPTITFNSQLKMKVTPDRRMVRIDYATGNVVPRPYALDGVALY